MADPAGSAADALAPKGPPAPLEAEPQAVAPRKEIWQRIREHKILQWGLGYLGAALALAHGAELLGHAFHWPEIVQRTLLGVLIVGLPLALTLAWYHGHKGLKGVSQGEMMIASILLVIGAGLLMVLVRAPGENSQAPAVTTAAAPSATTSTTTFATPRTSVAVVPFANLTGDPAKEYFSDGMAEEMIDTLARVPNLKVPARTSSFAYKGKIIDIRQIGRDLGVGTILEGSVRSAGERIRVTAQLVDAQSGFHLWSQSYDREFKDIFKLQDELASAILEALKINLGNSGSTAVVRTPPTQNLEAYQLYLRGVAAAHGSEQSLREARTLYQQAIDLDPQFARAYAELASVDAAAVRLGYSWAVAASNAEIEVKKAIAIDPSLALAHAVLGDIHALKGEWVAAEREILAALSLSDNDPAIYAFHSVSVLFHTGRLRLARQQAQRTFELAPASWLGALDLAGANSLMGFDGESLRYAGIATGLGYPAEVAPLPEVRADAALRAGNFAEAAQSLAPGLPADIQANGGREVIYQVFNAFADSDKKPAAIVALDALLAKVDVTAIDPYTIGTLMMFYTKLGSLDRAFAIGDRWLAHQRSQGLVGPAWATVWKPEMRAFRKDPRFQAFATRLGLMDYWKEYGPPDDCDLQDGKLTCR
jgi:TolB-like protein